MKNLLIEYEMYLLDKIDAFPEYHFKDTGTFAIEQTITALIKYVVEDVLKWTPEDAYILLNWNVLTAFKLDDLIDRYINFIPGMNEKEKCKFLICKCYPSKYHFDTKKIFCAFMMTFCHLKKLNGIRSFLMVKKEPFELAYACRQQSIAIYMENQ